MKKKQLSYQQQTVLNLHSCGISHEVIALQLDISKKQVNSILKKVTMDNKRKEKSIKEVSDSSSLSMFYLDAVVNVDKSIKDAQTRMWKSLKWEPKFDIPLEQTQEILDKFSNSKIILVILHVDLVGSTELSMTLPTEKLATIVQSFTQEMSSLVSMYGGHVFKYVGDALLAFFDLRDGNLYLPCSNAVSCARAMIRVMKEGINPILEEYEYPEMAVRIGIDVGENMVVQYGWSTNAYKIVHGNNTTKNTKGDNKKRKMNTTKDSNPSSEHIIRKPHLDILGYTTSIAAKMTGFAEPNQIVIGQSVYENLGSINRNGFIKVEIKSEDWNYINPTTGTVYGFYSSTI
jgi:adenylate cyclase